jgi:hypothetical protein
MRGPTTTATTEGHRPGSAERCETRKLSEYGRYGLGEKTVRSCGRFFVYRSVPGITAGDILDMSDCVSEHTKTFRAVNKLRYDDAPTNRPSCGGYPGTLRISSLPFGSSTLRNTEVSIKNRALVSFVGIIHLLLAS